MIYKIFLLSFAYDNSLLWRKCFSWHNHPWLPGQLQTCSWISRINSHALFAILLCSSHNSASSPFFTYNIWAFLSEDYPTKFSLIYLSLCPWSPSIFCWNFYIVGYSSYFFFFKGKQVSLSISLVCQWIHGRTEWLASPRLQMNTIKSMCLTELQKFILESFLWK